MKPFQIACAYLAGLSTAQTSVWTTTADPQGLLQRYQPQYKISKLIASQGIVWSIMLPNDDACIVNNAGVLQLFTSQGPKPCSVNVSSDAASVTIQGYANSWYMTAQLNGTLDCCDPGKPSASYCNASHAGSFLVQQSGSCATANWLQIDWNPPWSLNGGRMGFSTHFQERLGVVIVGGANASSGRALNDSWSATGTYDQWRPGGNIPAGCDALDLLSFQLDGYVYLVCPDAASGLVTVYGLDGSTLQWSAVQISVPPPPALPPVRYQSTQFAELIYDSPSAATVDRTPQRNSLRAGAAVANLLVQGGCLIALTGGPGVVTPGGNTVLHRSLDGVSWVNWTTPIPSRTGAAIVSFALPGQSSSGLGIAGGVDVNGSYLGDAYSLSGQLCCASSCDEQGRCVICNEQGTCTLNGQSVCTCNEGWGGDFCTIVIPTPSPTPTPTVPAPPPAGRSNTLIPGLPDTGALAVVIVSSLAAAILFVSVAWRVRVARRATPGVPKTATVTGAVRDFR